MCIVCDIKQAVEVSGPNKEDRAKILGLVEKLAEALGAASRSKQSASNCAKAKRQNRP